jgi:CRISPR-associated endonuclease/helicase Cas3
VTYPEFFRSLTENSPYPYQERVASNLFDGRSLIFRAPTGAGKTWAVTAPFLYSLAIGNQFADRLLYALPLRSLATSLHASVHTAMNDAGSFGEVSTTAKDREYGNSMRHCSLQIGGQKDDPFFESDLVFTTIDQLLSSYLFLPVSLPDRLGNMNAGALVGSLVIFDELHLFDPDTALGTTIEMLDRLKGICQFVLMTATLSSEGIRWLAKKLGAVALTLTDDEVRELPSQRTKERTWNWSSAALTAQQIHDSHNGGRTIALVNTVDRAQKLFEEVDVLFRGTKTVRLLLHSRFYPGDRKAIENRLASHFGPKATQSDVVLITTQVIEAGIDISTDHLHTELAPMNALVQRAGRTARYQHRNIGRVTVYEIETLGPYREITQQQLIAATRTALEGLAEAGNPIDFAEEQSWIEQVHRGEAKQLARYEFLTERRTRVHQAMDTGNRGLLPELVRDINSINILLSENPEAVDFSKRAWPRMLSVSPYALYKPLRPHFEKTPHESWVVKAAVVSTDETRDVRFDWNSLKSEKDLASQWLIAIHPHFATYDPILGLVLGRSGPALPIEYADLPPFQRYQYQFESWVDHASRIVNQSQKMRPAYKRGTELLAESLGLTASAVEELIDLACRLHDAGKLADAWQEAAWSWQNDRDKRRGHPLRTRIPIAHTSYDPIADKPFQNRPEYNLPPHAVEGAYAVCESVTTHLVSRNGEEKGLLASLAAVSAIARHHGPRTHKLSPFSISSINSEMNKDVEIAGSALKQFFLRRCDSPSQGRLFGQGLFRAGNESNEPAWALYSVLIRRLRLSDQASFK